MDWMIVFMLLALKIPIVYLCGVIWWAIKATPTPPGEELGVDAEPTADPGSPWTWWREVRGRRPRRGGPHATPSRRVARAPRPASASAKAERR